MSFIQNLASQRTCTIADHNLKNAQLICSYEKCEETTRWACVDCLRKNLHQHNSQGQGYLMDQMEFVKYLEEKNKEILDHNQQSCKIIGIIQQRLKTLLSEINELQIIFYALLEQNKSNSNNVRQIQEMINNVKQDFFQMSDENVNSTIHIKNNQSEISSYQMMNYYIDDFAQKIKQFNINNQSFKIGNLYIKQNLQQNQLLVEGLNKQQSQLKPFSFASPNHIKVTNQVQNSYNQVQTQLKYDEASKQLNQQLIKQIPNNHLAQSQIQSVQSSDSLSQLPQPLSLSQVQQKSSIQNIHIHNIQMNSVQGIQIKPLNIQNQVQRRDVSQVRFNPFLNSQGSKQSQQTINYIKQPFQKQN